MYHQSGVHSSSSIIAKQQILLPLEILENSPSKKDGVSEVDEMIHRFWGCELIQEAGILLRLPQVAMVTGQTLFHRFFYRCSLKKYGAFSTAMASIFLGAKIEEKQKRIRDVINVFNHMYQKRRELPIQSIELGGERYIEWKDTLIRIERQVLIELGFSMYNVMEHPHKFILYYIKVIDGSAELAQASWNYLNDSLRTTLCVRYRAEVIACAAIYLASCVQQIQLPNHPPWWELFDATKEDITSISMEIFKLYTFPKIKWLNPLLH